MNRPSAALLAIWWSAMAPSAFAADPTTVASSGPSAPGTPAAPPTGGVPQPHNWAGIYIGANGGVGIVTSDWVDPNNPSAASSGNFGGSSGLMGGGTFGANFQDGPFVYGVELDIDGGSLTASASPGNGFCRLTNPAGAPATNCETQTH